jgi:hypothetical protein
MLAVATKVVTSYGHVLGQAEAKPTGLPESMLPYKKQQIREALRFLLSQLGPGEAAVREGLKRGYVYLAQFRPDLELASVAESTDPFAQMRALAQVKLAMEEALAEVDRF